MWINGEVLRGKLITEYSAWERVNKVKEIKSKSEELRDKDKLKGFSLKRIIEKHAAKLIRKAESHK